MSVIRVEKNQNYTCMSNYHLKEKDMSLKAKGLLSLMLSLPDNWDYSINGLVSICKENETSIKSTLSELKEFGYLEVIKNTPNATNGGRISYDYIVHEKPIQDIKKQGVENLGVENQAVENQVQLNTNILSTNQLSTNCYLKKERKKERNENAKCIMQKSKMAQYNKSQLQYYNPNQKEFEDLDRFYAT